MFESIDNFFIWIKKAEFVSDVIKRIVAVVIVLGIGGLLWFISISILAIYLYSRFGNKRISGIRCSRCMTINGHNDKFCIKCGNNLQENKATNKQTPLNSDLCKCPSCSATNSCNDKFCIQCGKKLQESTLYNEILNSFDGIIVALLSKIAKVDGVISQKEANYLSSTFDMLAKQRTDVSNVKEIYKEISSNEKNKLSNIDEMCNKLSTFNTEQKFKEDIIKIFIELAYIDGKYDKDEENIIVKIVHKLHLDFSIYQSIKDEFEPKQKSQSTSSANNLTLDQCYEILESKKSDEMQIIKSNYRRLIKQYHYDSMASKGLPDEMLKFAEEKTKTLNEAYEKIKKSRG